MLKVLINGCNGKMGQILANSIKNDDDTTVVSGVDRSPNKFKNPFPVYPYIFDVKENIDIVIDFSNPYYLSELLDFAVERKIPLVIATTGLSNKNIKDIKNTSTKIPIFQSANMSLGIHVLVDLAQKASSILGDSFDIEIIEKHHNKKIDAPSGTAYMIANNINKTLDNSKEYTFGRHTKKDKRKNNEIGIHAIRGGTIVGEHNIIFAGEDEIIEIKHSASSKSIFALGAIKAAKFIKQKNNGLYSMNDLIKF